MHPQCRWPSCHAQAMPGRGVLTNGARTGSAQPAALPGRQSLCLSLCKYPSPGVAHYTGLRTGFGLLARQGEALSSRRHRRRTGCSEPDWRHVFLQAGTGRVPADAPEPGPEGLHARAETGPWSQGADPTFGAGVLSRSLPALSIPGSDHACSRPRPGTCCPVQGRTPSPGPGPTNLGTGWDSAAFSCTQDGSWWGMALFEGRPAPPASSIHAQGRILSFCLSFCTQGGKGLHNWRQRAGSNDRTGWCTQHREARRCAPSSRQGRRQRRVTQAAAGTRPAAARAVSEAGTGRLLSSCAPAPGQGLHMHVHMPGLV